MPRGWALILAQLLMESLPPMAGPGGRAVLGYASARADGLGGAVGMVLRDLDGPDRLRIEIGYPAAMLGAMRLRAARPSIPFLLATRRGEAIEEASLEGQDGAVLRRPLASGLPLVVDVEAESSFHRRYWVNLFALRRADGLAA